MKRHINLPIGPFIGQPELQRIRQQLTQVDVIAHRGVILTRNGATIGEVDEIGTARLLVDLHNNGLALVNEVERLRTLSESLWKQNRELILANPEMQPRGY